MLRIHPLLISGAEQEATSSGNFWIPEWQYDIEAVGRSQCTDKFVNFPTTCTTDSPDKVYLGMTAEKFRIYPVSSTKPKVNKVGTSFVCPDPYVWKPKNSSNYQIQCTGGGLKIGVTSDLNPATGQFKYIGDALGGTPAPWTPTDHDGSRWAPENYETPDGKGNYIFFSDSSTSSGGVHRLGWVYSHTGPNVGAYTKYAPTFMDLGLAPGGDIDSTVFTDSDGKTYLVWKTDDNNVHDAACRVWAQELVFANEKVEIVGKPVVLMDSTGLWWVEYDPGMSLIEGPEIVYQNGYYYLFFASGRYCSDIYTEGVARSKSLFGPYEKMQSPLLNNGIVGVAKNGKGELTQLVGPGHATYVKLDSGEWRIIFHASIGQNCDRYSFIGDLVFGKDGWPYLNL
eukprot:gene39166-48376_t